VVYFGIALVIGGGLVAIRAKPDALQPPLVGNGFGLRSRRGR
jgi:hypothetical protein